MMKQVCQEQKSESRQIFLAFTNRNVSSVKKTYVRSSPEKLVKATQLRVDETLRNIATENCDHKIMSLTSREIVAAEAHYTGPATVSRQDLKSKGSGVT